MAARSSAAGEGAREQVVLDPVISEFQELIDSDAVVRMYVHQMIAQVPAAKPYRQRHVESVEGLLRLMNEVLTMAPEFGSEMVALPLNAILDWTMGTSAGFAAYRDRRMNAMLRRSSQSYLAHVAARAIFVIEADDPVIGLMAFVPVGMSDVSSCLIDAKIASGYHVSKGEELRYFQFGWSTHCLVFRPDAIAELALAAIPQPHDPDAPVVRVNSRLAVAH